MNATLKAGWSAVSITPHGREVSLSGQYYERITSEIDCELMASALALKGRGESMTWVTCDIVGITDRLLEAVRKYVKVNAPNIKTENIILSAIHTHNAPYVQYSNVLGRSGYFKDKPGIMTDAEYHTFAVQCISKAVISANENLQGGFSFRTGSINIRTGCSRRGILKNGDGVMYIDTSRPDFIRMEGPDGGPVGVMYLENSSGQLKGIIACIPCTAQVLEHQFVMSSDYTGRIREMLWKEFGNDFIFLPMISAAGDLSPRNLITKDYGLGNMYTPAGADSFAEKIFNGLIDSYKGSLEVPDISNIRISKTEIKLPGWIPTAEDYKWAKSIIETKAVEYDISDYVQKGIEPYFRQPLALARKAESIITKYENKSTYESLDIEMTAVRMGGTVWVTNPFELYIEFGNRITAGAKADAVWPIQLVNGYKGYFPTAEAVKAGGYSAYIQSVRVEPKQAGEILVKESIALANSLFD